MKDNLKMYYQTLRHQLKKYCEHKLTSQLNQIKVDGQLDYYLVNTRKEETNSAEMERRDLEEALEDNGEYDC